MSKQLRELQARKSALVKDARTLTEIAAAEQRVDSFITTWEWA